MRNTLLVGAALAAFAVIGFSASALVQPASAASSAKQTTLKSDDAGDNTPSQYDANGLASWYGGSFHGRLDARGERFDENAMTAAHRTLPLDSWVAVTNLTNGRRVVVRITDRGPYAHRRVIDLSHSAAAALGYVDAGIARVNVRAVAAP